MIENQVGEPQRAGACTHQLGNLSAVKQQLHNGNDEGGQAQSTVDALLSSARELSMLESALQHPPAVPCTQVRIMAGKR